MPSIDLAALDAKVETVFPQVVAWRRHIHAHPDLSFHEEPTANYIAEEIRKLDPEGKYLTITRPIPNALYVDLKGTGGDGPMIALRADIDALPVQEAADVSFRSTKDSAMHACGHDTHTAMLMGAVALLVKEADRIKGTVRFLFQHAEEVPPGGAREMVKHGCMEGVSMVFGLHIFNARNTPTGSVMVRSGPIMSSSDQFEARIIGMGGHASMPDMCIDPVVISASVVTALQQIVSRRMPAAKTPVFTVATIKTSTDSYNVIPTEVVLKGTLRTQDRKVREDAKRLAVEMTSGITTSLGGQCEFIWHDGYDLTVNDEKAFAVSERVLEQVLPSKDKIVYMPTCLGGSEDFGEFAKCVPGNYYFVGAYNEAEGCTAPNHSATCKFDEEAFKVGVKAHYGHIHELLM